MKNSLTYKEVPLEILDCQVRKLRNKKVTFVKVLWRILQVHGSTWEEQAAMKANYPHLFSLDSILARCSSLSSSSQLTLAQIQS